MTPFMAVMLAGLATSTVVAQQCPPAITIDRVPQVFVMSDISNVSIDDMTYFQNSTRWLMAS